VPDLKFRKKVKFFGSKIDLKSLVSNDSHIVSPAPGFRINLPLNKPSTLIIDDEKDICYLLSNILKQKNIRADIAFSLTEANDIIDHSEEFSFVFLDNYLPDGLGVNYIRQIKKNCPLCKVIMITAHDNQTDREKARFEGADFFISKPFSRELILKTIDGLSA
jgi:DNA-binding response OmpR family regulator